MNRFNHHYNHIIRYDLLFKDVYRNPMQSPRIRKIVLNTGIGRKAVIDRKQIISVLLALEMIAGQKPLVTRARRSVDKFKLRENMPIGRKLTSRSRNLNLFLDRLVNLVLSKPGLEELTDLSETRHFRGPRHPEPQQAHTIPRPFKFSPLDKNSRATRETVISKSFGALRSLARSAAIKKYFTRAFGIKDFLAFREMEPHYNKFDAAHGLDIILALDDFGPGALGLKRPIYLLSGYQVPLR